jgi:hypothetical protein
MTRAASRDRPVTHEIRLRLAMASEAEVMKARLDPDAKIGPAAAVTTDARALPAPIEIVVVTDDTAHGAMLIVREVQYQALGAREQRLTQSERRGSAGERNERNEGREHHDEYDPRVSSEHEAAKKARAPA